MKIRADYLMPILVWAASISLVSVVILDRIPPHLAEGQQWEMCYNEDNPYTNKTCTKITILDVDNEWVKIKYSDSRGIGSKKKRELKYWDLVEQ